MGAKKYQPKKFYFFIPSIKILENSKVEVEVEKDLIEEESSEGYIFCKLCFSKITINSEKTFINGHFSYEFTNPFGIQFIIGTFNNASGCATKGPPTAEASWFPGYEWNVAECNKCNEHLGWNFQKESDSFYGLILTKLEGDI